MAGLDGALAEDQDPALFAARLQPHRSLARRNFRLLMMVFLGANIFTSMSVYFPRRCRSPASSGSTSRFSTSHSRQITAPHAPMRTSGSQPLSSSSPR